MQQIERALSGLKVLEFAEMVAGPYCTKIMADLGAEVIKIETPGVGDETRRIGPFLHDKPDPEKSGLFIYLNSNKWGITLDLEKEEGKRLLKELAAKADILIEANLPARMRELGLTYDDLKEINPRLIMVSITPFGQTGPYSDYKGYTLNICQGSGESYYLQTQDMDREPLKVGGFADDFDAGMTAGVAALGAYISREMTGTGVHLDISEQEVMISLGRVDQVRYANDDMLMTRNIQAVLLGGEMLCRNGYVNVIAVQNKQWEGIMKVMGEPDWGRGKACKDEIARAFNADFLNKKLKEWMLKHDKEYIYHKMQEQGVPITPVYNVKDIVESPQMEVREFFQKFEQPGIGEVTIPQGPYRFSETPWSILRPAPRLGEHNREVFIDLLKMSENNFEALMQEKVI